jgi:hypothetical protein
MSELPDDMKTTLTNLDASLTALEEHLDPLFEIPWDVLTARLEPMEKAKLNLMMAYSAASLFYMYLKSQVAVIRYNYFDYTISSLLITGNINRRPSSSIRTCEDSFIYWQVERGYRLFMIFEILVCDIQPFSWIFIT